MAKITEVSAHGNVMYTRDNNWMEITEPKLFNFESFGQQLEGVVCEMRMEKIEGRDVVTVRMELAGGDQVKFRPSFDLRQKLGKRLIGRRVLIVYDRDNDATQDKGNPMKVFRVFVAPETNASPFPFVASDADVPSFEDSDFRHN